MNNDTNEIQIDLLEYCKALLAQWWMLLLSAIVGGALFLGYTWFMVEPTYQASCTMYAVNSVTLGSARVSISSADISATRSLLTTYGVILKSRLTLEEVIEKAGVNYSTGKLSSMIASSAVSNTEILQITVTSTDPTEACLIANTIAEVLPEKITKIVKASSVEIVDLAVVPSKAADPDYMKNTAIGALLGLILCAAAILLFQFLLNDTIESEDWVRDTFKDVAPVIGRIPLSGDAKADKYGYGYDYGYNYSSEETKKK